MRINEPLTGGELTLILQKEVPADPAREWVRGLYFSITHPKSTRPVGAINVRLGYTQNIVRYAGHIGYEIDSHWRGHHYAGKACRMLQPLMMEHGMDVVWITCDPGNPASRKTCEWIGASLVEVVDLPPENDMWQRGMQQVCRYRWLLY